MGKKGDTKKHPSRQKPPPIDQYVKPAIALGVALLAYQFFKGLNSEIKRINVEDELELRDVFFGEGETGKNYAVLCHDENSKIPVSSVFQDAHNDGSSKAEFRLVNCDYVLPSSEKTIAERFKFNMKDRPIMFVSGAIGEPKQVPSKHLKTGNMLLKALRSLLEPKAGKVETTQDLRNKCLEKDICGLLLKGSKQAPSWLKDAMGKLVKEFPNVSLTAIDSSVLYVKNLEDQIEEFDENIKQHRFVIFKKVSGSTDAAGKGRLITSIIPLQENLSYGSMSNLLASAASGSATPKKLSALPMVKTRTKKLVAEEKAKRERKSDQSKRQASGGSSTPGGAFTENDGSREGRKAERERRRAEHHANNPDFKPKTPEEIQEMERKRRERMEKMAEEWTIDGEDLPPEGDPYDDEDLEDFDEETSTYEVHDDYANDGEDVMDLD